MAHDEVEAAGSDHWHGELRHVRGSQLSGNTNQTTGMTRYEAVSGKTVEGSPILRVTFEPGTGVTNPITQ